MKRIILFALMIALLVVTPCFAGVAHYVNCEGSGTNSGTYANPFLSYASMAAHSYANGDDVYFMEGTTCVATTHWDIEITGTSGDHIDIGCYDGEDDFVCDGAAPIIKGNQRGEAGTDVPSADWAGLINWELVDTNAAVGWIHINYLEIKNSASYAIQLAGPDSLRSGVNHKAECTGASTPFACCTGPKQGDTCAHAESIIVENCILHNSDRTNLGLYWVSDSVVQYNKIYSAPDYAPFAGGSNFHWISGTDKWANWGETRNNVAQYNEMWDCRECIGVYNFSDYGLIQYNHFHVDSDNDADAIIYIEGSKYNTVRYNVIHANDGYGNPGGDRAIWIDNEYRNNYDFIGINNNDIYGNLIAGVKTAFMLECTVCNSYHCQAADTPSDCCTGLHTGTCENHWNSVTNNNFYNNTVVDSDILFGFDPDWPTATYNPSANVKNNIFIIHDACPVGSCTITNKTSPRGVTFSHNLLSSNPGGNFGNATGTVIADPDVTQILSKTTGWRSMSAATVTGNEWRLVGGSPAINVGTQITTTSDDCSSNITAACVQELDQANLTAWPMVFGSLYDNNDYVTQEIGGDIQYCVPVTPSITDPTPSETGVELDREVNSSAFADQSGCSTSHVSSDWEIDTTTDFLSPDKYSYDSTSNKITWTPTLPANGLLYIRVRHTNTNGDSAWSTPVYFETEGSDPESGPISLLITGDNNTILWSLINGLNEESTGIKVASGATGNKIYNTTIVNCGLSGIDADEDVTVKNVLFRNNAGPDIDIASGKTVTASNNSIQDAAKTGDGTYDSGTSDFSKPYPFKEPSNYRLGAGVEERNGGVALYSAIWYDLVGRQVTDVSGNPLLGSAVDRGAFEFNKNAMTEFRKSFAHIY